MMTTAWTAAHVRSIDTAGASRVPTITRVDRSALSPDRIYWDMWPVQSPDGFIARLAGRELWMALSAPPEPSPSARHFTARIRLIERKGGAWHDLGDVLPPRAMPYEREWAGSAVADDGVMTLHLTGAGSGMRPGGYQQRLYAAHASIGSDGLPRDWSIPVETVGNAAPWYMPADAHEGEAGKIKAFRDPAHFRDPADGCDYLVFTASLAGSESAYNGAVGLARRDGEAWTILPPLVHADGVNNELERAHVVAHGGRYLLFWATQNATFAPDLREAAPGGLYGMVADSLAGPWRPLNGSGLVLCNPADEPLQTYSWFVSAELMVSSFVDLWGLKGRTLPLDGDAERAHFGGAPAPLLQLSLDGDRCRLVETVAA